MGGLLTRETMATNLLLEKKELKPLLYPVSEGISDEEWLRLHKDQLVGHGVPEVLHETVARKLNGELFDAFRTFGLMDDENNCMKVMVGREEDAPAHSDAWVADHALGFSHQREAKGALAAHPGLKVRFGSMANCDDEDVLDLCIWRFAKTLPRGPRDAPRFYVEDGATQGCFNRTSTLECLSDHKGVKNEASTLRETSKRDDHLGPNEMSFWN